MIKTDIDDNALMVAFRGDDPAADEALGLLGESDRVFVSSFRCIDRRGYYLRSPPTPSSRLRASNCFRGGIAVSLANMLDATTEAALGAFRCRLEERFGPRLRGLVLFGSRARGDHHDESDADVAVFLRPVADPIAAQMDMATDAYAPYHYP